MIQRHMESRQSRHFGVGFSNPDLVAYAERFGMPAYRIGRSEKLLPALRVSL